MTKQFDLRLELVQPTCHDARLIMQWRNDPHTRAMSFRSHEKRWESFYQEFLDEYFTVPSLPPLFIVIDHQRVAVVLFERCKHPLNEQLSCCEISINLDPNFRSQGLGTYILKYLQTWVAKQGFSAIYAAIKAENISSKKAFLKAGYRSIGQASYQQQAIEQFLVNLNSQQRLKTFIIAEIGSNWCVGNDKERLDLAKKLIHLAAEAGVDAVKFQTFEAASVYVSNAGKSDYLSEAGIEQDIVEIFEQLSMPKEVIPLLAKECTNAGVEFMSTAFSSKDFYAIDPFVKRHKIASYEMNDIHLLELAAKSGKPLILSTGACEIEEVDWSVNYCKKLGIEDLTLLQCVAKYPADLADMNLKVIATFQERFKVATGLSDHTRHPCFAPVMAVTLGASVIEKHFTLDNSLPGPDHAFALTPVELKEMVRAIRITEEGLGNGVKDVRPSELELRAFARRGIQAIREIKKSEPLIEGINIAVLRPGKQKRGIHPLYLKELEGKRASRNISLGDGIQIGDWL